MYKKIKALGVMSMLGLSLGLVPSIALAAFNDAVLTPDTVISVGGVTLNITGPTAVVSTITVDASTFTFTLLPNSFLQVTSFGRNVLKSDAPANIAINNTCTGTESLSAFYSVTDTVTVTVTPSTTVCTPILVTSGGGGGGSSYYSSTSTSQIVNLATSTATSTPSNSSPASTISTTVPFTNQPTTVQFTRFLSLGSRGKDVSALQMFLLSNGFLNESQVKTKGYFGKVTKKALMKYQQSVGINPNGRLGPATLAYINKTFLH